MEAATPAMRMKERRDTPGKTFDEFIDCSFVPIELEIERTRTAKLLESGEREFIQPYTTIESWESRKCQAMSGANPMLCAESRTTGDSNTKAASQSRCHLTSGSGYSAGQVWTLNLGLL